MQVHQLRLPPEAQCVHDGLSRRSSGSGPSYLYKPLLPWALPRCLRRLIVLDSDVVPLIDIQALHAEFARFCGRLIGLVREQSLMYPRALHDDGLVGFNGGVQLLDLAAMRTSVLYARALERTANGGGSHKQGWQKAGFLGDQTLYTFLNADFSGALVHELPCEYNRQLGSDFIQANRHSDAPDPSLPPDAPRFGFTNAAVHACPRRCALLHANLPPLKCVARFMHANPSCAGWEAFQRALASPNRTSGGVHDLLLGSCPALPVPNRQALLDRAVKRHFADCCVPTYRGPLRTPEGAAGVPPVTTAMRAALQPTRKTARGGRRRSGTNGGTTAGSSSGLVEASQSLCASIRTRTRPEE